MNKEKNTAVLFDLDGTLWNASPGVAKAWNEGLRQLDRPADVTPKTVQSYMGWTMQDIADDLFSDVEDSAARLEMTEMLGELENEVLAREGGILFDQVREVLKELKETYFLGIVSNCQAGYIEAFLKAHGLEELFDDWMCWADTQQEKGVTIAALMEKDGLKKAVYIGDTGKDEEAARKAGLPFILAGWGFGDAEAPGAAADSFAQLPDLIDDILMD